MTEEEIAKNYLLNKICDTCLYFDIEFNGMLFCSYEEHNCIPSSKTCENWQNNPFDNPVEKLMRDMRHGRKFDS